MNYYEHHLGDYMRDTAHLSLTEDGIYRRLIDAYYAREKPLPSDLTECCKLARVSGKKERDAVRYILREFFQLVDGCYRQKRCDEVIEKYNSKKNKARDSANARWNAERSDSDGNADAMRTHSDGNAPNLQSPVTSNQEDSRRGEAPSVDQAIYADARKVFGKSIGGQIGKAIKNHGKPWIVGIIDACRSKDPEAARAYLAAAMNGVRKPDEAEQRRQIP